MADDDTTTGNTDGTDQSSSGAAGDAADPQKVIEDLRKRQSGADKARDVAIAERNALQARLEALTSGKAGSEDSGNQPKDEAAIRAEVAKEFEQKLASERAADLAKVLDATFPVARKKFPTLTDAAQLAELETVFGEDKTPAPPKTLGNNPQGGSGNAKNLEDMSVTELRAELDKQASGVLNPKS